MLSVHVFHYPCIIASSLGTLSFIPPSPLQSATEPPCYSSECPLVCLYRETVRNSHSPWTPVSPETEKPWIVRLWYCWMKNRKTAIKTDPKFIYFEMRFSLELHPAFFSLSFLGYINPPFSRVFWGHGEDYNAQFQIISLLSIQDSSLCPFIKWD